MASHRVIGRSLSESSTGSETEPDNHAPFKVPRLDGAPGTSFGRTVAAAAPVHGAASRRDSHTTESSTTNSSSDEDDTSEDEGRRNQLGRTAPSAAAVTSGAVGGSYSSFAEKMMSKMGYEQGKGLGKSGQGIVEPVEASNQRGRRGLGMIVKGFDDPNSSPYDPTKEHIEVVETVRWLPRCDQPSLSLKELRTWTKEGPRKETIDDETRFCDPEVLDAMLRCKSIFDNLEAEEMRKARTRSNPFESIRCVFFLNRAAMKMANIDAVFDFMFTNPMTPDQKPILQRNELMYFADVCAGPGGFSEYVLWKKKWRAKGFGFTLKGSNDFKLEDFFAGPPESFETHYGVDGRDGDGDVFREDNFRAFKKFVLENTDNKGVHFMMADGGFSVDGNENIQEILSKQLYLCQFLFALGVVRTGGHFVCKLFDLFTPFSVGLLYLMYRSFDLVCIHKPNTSRPANSERYIICKHKRPDSKDVADYLFEVNCRLNQLGFTQLGATRSETDVNEVVPMEVLRGDTEFFDYVVESNNALGEWQVAGLAKIRAFAADPNLHELKQKEIRDSCLKFWNVPNDVRRAPQNERPQNRLESMLGRQGGKFLLSHALPQLTTENHQTLLKASVYDWKCVLLGGSDVDGSDRGFYLGMGRTKVFHMKPKGGWERMEDGLKFELSRGSLVYGEVVKEMRGEARSMRRVMAFHIIDAVFLGDEDLRSLDYVTRIEMCRTFAKAMNKSSALDTVTIRVKEVFGLERLDQVLDRLKMRQMKGSGGKYRLTCDIEEAEPSSAVPRYFCPSSLLLQKIVRAPYIIAMSKSQRRKYWSNTITRQSVFECPREAAIDFATAFDQRLEWRWDDGVQLSLDQEYGVLSDANKLHAKDMLNFIHSKL